MNHLTPFLSAVGLLAVAFLAQAQPEPVSIKGHQAHPTRILAKYASGERARAKAAAVAVAGLNVKHEYSLVPGLVVLELAEGAALKAVDPQERASKLLAHMDALRQTGLFEFVEPDYLVQTQLSPDDAAFADGTLWGLRNTGQSGGVYGADIDAGLGHYGRFNQPDCGRHRHRHPLYPPRPGGANVAQPR
jgi:hypothetical protein